MTPENTRTDRCGPEDGRGGLGRRERVISALLLIWAVVASLFFFIRFSFVFFEAHREPVIGVLHRLTGS